MRIFDFCCQTKSKKTIDYISSWIDATEIELKQMHTDISKLSASMSGIVTEELGPIFDAYAQTYDYSSVIPELSTLQTEIKALGNALENKIDTPLTPASVLKGYIVTWGDNKTLHASTKKVSDLALASHTHTTEDITDLSEEFGKSTEINVPLLFTDGQYITGTQDEAAIKDSLKDLIRRAVADSESMYVNVCFNIGSNDAQGHSYHDGYYYREHVNIWSEAEVGYNERYDFHIEVCTTSGNKNYTVVYDVRRGTSGLDFSNSSFAPEWGIYYQSVKSNKLRFDDTQGLIIPSMTIEALTKMWLGCVTGREYPIMIELRDDHEQITATLYGHVIAGGKGDSVATLDIYFNDYHIFVESEEHAGDIRKGIVPIANASWSLDGFDDWTDLSINAPYY